MEDESKIIEKMMGLVYDKARELYSNTVVDHGINPRNYGIMDTPDGYARVTGTWGDTIELFLRVRNGTIEDTKFTTDGCAFTIAASSVVTEMAKGKTFVQCLKINQSAILDYLEKVPEDHTHCAYLAALAFHRALKDSMARVRKR